MQETTLFEKVANAPPVAVAGATIFGYSLPDIAAIVTIIYTLVLLYLRGRKEYEKWKAKREARDSGLPEPVFPDDEDSDKAPL